MLLLWSSDTGYHDYCYYYQINRASQRRNISRKNFVIMINLHRSGMFHSLQHLVPYISLLRSFLAFGVTILIAINMSLLRSSWFYCDNSLLLTCRSYGAAYQEQKVKESA